MQYSDYSVCHISVWCYHPTVEVSTVYSYSSPPSLFDCSVFSVLMVCELVDVGIILRAEHQPGLSLRGTN